MKLNPVLKFGGLVNDVSHANTLLRVAYPLFIKKN